MFIYKIGYHSYEDSYYHELWHEKEFTQEEFENMFVESVLQLLTIDRAKCLLLYYYDEGGITKDDIEFYTEQLKKHYKKTEITIQEIFEYCKESHSLQYTKFSDIHEETANLMAEKFGFQKVKYTAEISVNGWGGIVDKGRYFGEEDEVLNRISKKFWEIKDKNEQ